MAINESWIDLIIRWADTNQLDKDAVKTAAYKAKEELSEALTKLERVHLCPEHKIEDQGNMDLFCMTCTMLERENNSISEIADNKAKLSRAEAALAENQASFARYVELSKAAIDDMDRKIADLKSELDERRQPVVKSQLNRWTPKG